ncbi:hypothetical protein I4U23_013796 [Adineta vaga]|nr:hypothetical protein I4U23_013796 [Adineta vaga]
MHHLLQLSCVALLAFVLLTNNIVQSAPFNGPDDDDSSEILDTRGILGDFKEWVTDLFHKIGLTKREQCDALDHMIRSE